MSQIQTFAIAPTCFGLRHTKCTFLTAYLQTKFATQFLPIRRVDHGLIRRGFG